MNLLRGVGLAVALSGCVSGTYPITSERCDPRTLEVGEVRARPIWCNDELIGGGEGRMGDWLIENAVARFVVRGTYAPLTELEGDGGTLIDAALVGGADLLAELTPAVDRSTLVAVNGDGWAELRLPGLTWHLDAEAAAIELRAPAEGDDPEAGPADPADVGWDARLLPLVGVRRTGTTLLSGTTWMGADGVVVAGAGAAELTGVTRFALTTAALWPDGVVVEGYAEANRVLVEQDGVELTRLPLVYGDYAATVPADATLAGERGGCLYGATDALTSPGAMVPVVCDRYTVQVRDQDGRRLPAALYGGTYKWAIPPGGGTLAVGPGPRDFEVYAGPAYSIAPVTFHGHEDAITVTLWRDMDVDHAVLANLDLRAAPDAATATASWDALHFAYSEGARYAAVVADDEIPVVDRYTHDVITPVAASRAADLVWSWPWTGNGRYAAHGAVPWQGLDALDLLRLSDGGVNAHRMTVVRAAWVEEARALAAPSAWTTRPDLLWLDTWDDLPTYLGLLTDWIPVSPVGPTTWVEVGEAVNRPAIERGLLDGATTAGNGPRLQVEATGPGCKVDDGATLPAAGCEVTVTVDASQWMGVHTVSLWTPHGTQTASVPGRGEVRFFVAFPGPWAVATATGTLTRPPFLDEPAWAVSGALWLDAGSPGG